MKSNLNEAGRRGAGHAPLLLLGLVTMSVLSATVGDQGDVVRLGPQNDLIISVERKGAKMRILRQLPPPSTASPPTTTSTTTFSSSSSGRPPVSSSASSTVSPAVTVSPAPMQTTAEVNVSIVELRELDANGNKIRQNDSSFRSFSAFGDQNFSITVLPDNHPVPNSGIRSAAAVESDAVLPPPFSGNVSVEACVAKDNGTVALGDEKMSLTKGQLKVNVEVRRWQWCDGACAGSQPARFLEADFVIQVANGRVVKADPQDQSYGYPMRYSLGKDAWAGFSRKVTRTKRWRRQGARSCPIVWIRLIVWFA